MSSFNRWPRQYINSRKLSLISQTKVQLILLTSSTDLPKTHLDIIEQFIYAKTPAYLKRSKIQAHLQNGTCEQIVLQVERELELITVEAFKELKVNTVNQSATKHDSQKPKPKFHYFIKPGHYTIHCLQLKRQKKSKLRT